MERRPAAMRPWPAQIVPCCSIVQVPSFGRLALGFHLSDLLPAVKPDAFKQHAFRSSCFLVAEIRVKRMRRLRRLNYSKCFHGSFASQPNANMSVITIIACDVYVCSAHAFLKLIGTDKISFELRVSFTGTNSFLLGQATSAIFHSSIALLNQRARSAFRWGG